MKYHSFILIHTSPMVRLNSALCFRLIFDRIDLPMVDDSNDWLLTLVGQRPDVLAVFIVTKNEHLNHESL